MYIDGTGHHPLPVYPRQERGIQTFKLTNQPRVNRGQPTVQDFVKKFAILGIDNASICPHSRHCRMVNAINRNPDNCGTRITNIIVNSPSVLLLAMGVGSTDWRNEIRRD